MRFPFFLITLLLLGCSEPDLESTLNLVGVQLIGQGVMNGDACKTIYREDGDDVKTPETFKVTPFEVIAIANDQLNYSCGHKWGAWIWADQENYYLTRGTDFENAIIINGIDGEIVSQGFLKRHK